MCTGNFSAYSQESASLPRLSCLGLQLLHHEYEMLGTVQKLWKLFWQAALHTKVVLA